MEAIPTNTAIFSGRGFRPLVPDPLGTVDVVAGAVRGADDLGRLRDAGCVRVLGPGPDTSGPVSDLRFGSALDPHDLVVRTVFWLALAGVPVTGQGLASTVRDRIDPGLLALMDSVEPATMADPGRRELLSLALRRQARRFVANPLARTQPAVAVLLPDGELTPGLERDLDGQTWPAVMRCAAPPEDSAAVLVEAQRDGAVYCTRMTPRVRYGPNHLADLVDALRHSGARAAHSPARFHRWNADAWLEDDAAAVEGAAGGGLPDASMWHAMDGPELPDAPGDGYAVHGSGAVPLEPPTAEDAVALRLHRGRPAVLAWFSHLVEPEAAGPERASLPRSYFQTVRTS